MTKKCTKGIIRIVLFVGTIISLYFVPWPIVKAWIAPLPNTIQEQVDMAADYGFDGIIVYADVKGKKPEFYAAGYKNRENICLGMVLPFQLRPIHVVDSGAPASGL